MSMDWLKQYETSWNHGFPTQLEGFPVFYRKPIQWTYAFMCKQMFVQLFIYLSLIFFPCIHLSSNLSMELFMDNN